MNIFRLIPLLWLPMVLFSAGCATTHRPEVNTWGDAQFAPTPTNTIAITDRLHPSAEDEALGRLLTDEMQRSGFIFAPAAQADFLLAYVTDDVSVEQPNFHALPQESMLSNQSLTPQTTGQILDGPGGPQSFVITGNTFVFHSKKISLYLYNNPQKSGDRIKMVWQGTIDAGKSVAADRERILLRTLLGYFGKVHGGEVDLVQ